MKKQLEKLLNNKWFIKSIYYSPYVPLIGLIMMIFIGICIENEQQVPNTICDISEYHNKATIIVQFVSLIFATFYIFITGIYFIFH